MVLLLVAMHLLAESLCFATGGGGVPQRGVKCTASGPSPFTGACHAGGHEQHSTNTNDCFMLFLTALGKISQEAEADQSDDDEDTLLLKQKIKATLRV